MTDELVAYIALAARLRDERGALEKRVKRLEEVLRIAIERHHASGCEGTCWFPADLARIALEAK